MKYCQKCNRDYPDTKKFCEKCGTLTSAHPADSTWCPHCGEPVQPSWKFCTKCRTKLPELASNQTTAPLQPSTSTARDVPTPISSPAAERHETADLQKTAYSPVFVRCRNCKQLVEEDSTFCEYCGANMFEDTAPLIVPPPPPPPPQRITNQQTYSRDTIFEGANGSEATAIQSRPHMQRAVAQKFTANKTAPSLSMLESYGQAEPAPQFKWWHGLLVAIFVLTVFAALGAGGWYWWSHRGSDSQLAPQTAANPAPTTATSSSSSNPQGQTIATQSADSGLKQLRASRVSAPPSDANKIVATIEDAEKKYPTNYRFAYERAKLSIKGMISHHEAFEAIFLAGARAIENGKAEEMLSDLISDKDGDFYKMSRGHREWTVLEEALKNKDKSALEKHDE